MFSFTKYKIWWNPEDYFLLKYRERIGYLTVDLFQILISQQFYKYAAIIRQYAKWYFVHINGSVLYNIYWKKRTLHHGYPQATKDETSEMTVLCIIIYPIVKLTIFRLSLKPHSFWITLNIRQLWFRIYFEKCISWY